MPETAYPIPLSEQLARLGQSWRWVFAMGVIYFTLGIVALSWPIDSTIGLTFALGVIFIASGAIQIVHAIHFSKEAGTGWRVFQAVAALAAGLLVLRFPGAGILGIAIALIFYFFASAAAKGLVALGLRPHRGWAWIFASATCSFFIGLYLIVAFPASALWVPGVVLGIDLLILGMSMAGFALDLRGVSRKKETAFDEKTGGRRAA